MCDPVLRYRKSGFLYNGRIFRGKSFCLVNNKKLTKITGGIISLRFYLKVKCNEQGEKEVISADLVVLAFGYKAYNPLEKIANELCEDVQVVGGAIKAGNALPAVKEGYEAALNIK